MFCNQCGYQLQADFKLCPQCGSAVAPAAELRPRTNLQRHLRILGILWIAMGVLWIIPSLVLVGLSHAPRIMIGDEMFTRSFMPPMLLSLGSVFLLVAAGGILVGWGLMNHERWARMTAIVVAILAILHPPLGTALGIYTLWVLVPAARAAEYEQLSKA